MTIELGTVDIPADIHMPDTPHIRLANGVMLYGRGWTTPDISTGIPLLIYPGNSASATPRSWPALGTRIVFEWVDEQHTLARWCRYRAYERAMRRSFAKVLQYRHQRGFSVDEGWMLLWFQDIMTWIEAGRPMDPENSLLQAAFYFANMRPEQHPAPELSERMLQYFVPKAKDSAEFYELFHLTHPH